MAAKVRTKREPIFHIARRQNVSVIRKWVSRILAIGGALILCALISVIMGGKFGDFFVFSFDACFVNLRTGAPSITKILDLLENTGILLLLALAVIPAFKMKFWNIGAEGQVSISILVSVILQKYLGPLMVENPAGRFFFFVIAVLLGILAGAVWAVIPAIFKAKFNTNETLFTLMMNYVALFLISMVIFIWSPKQGTVDMFPDNYYFPNIGGQMVTINLIIIAVVVALVFVYLKFTKRGYEINVVGGSTNTAKYIGLSVSKTIIRTMILSGAICGLCGALLIFGEHNNLTATIVNGRGFTGVMIAWLSGFGVVEVILYSFLGAYLLKGCRAVNYNVAFPNIMLAVFFFVLIACEFFVNYEIHSEKIGRWMEARFPKLYKNRKNLLEAPININDIGDEAKKEVK